MSENHNDKTTTTTTTTFIRRCDDNAVVPGHHVAMCLLAKVRSSVLT